MITKRKPIDPIKEFEDWQNHYDNLWEIRKQVKALFIESVNDIELINENTEFEIKKFKKTPDDFLQVSYLEILCKSINAQAMITLFEITQPLQMQTIISAKDSKILVIIY